MKKINLIEIPVNVDKKAFLNAVNARKPIGITVYGEIVPGAAESLPPNPYIYVGTPASLMPSALAPATPLAKILGDNYEVKDEGDKISIYAGRAWQELLSANEPFALYLDTTADGIAEFNDKALEEMLWYSCEFGLNYREVADHLEASCDGLILCVENERPYSFNGAVFVDDIEQARKEAKKFLTETIKKRLDEGKIDRDTLSDDEEEALNFFGLA
ncbi:hypothetical protein [Hydrogenimonas sp.]